MVNKEMLMRAWEKSLLLFPVFFAFFLTFAAPAFGAAIPQEKPGVVTAAEKGELNKILPVLEDKIPDRKLLEKSKEKIYSMGKNEVRLVAALCEKISDEGENAGSDIAFFLVTALIVLS
jgi:hypothetical protein